MEYIDFPMSLIFCLIPVASSRLFNRFSSAEEFDFVVNFWREGWRASQQANFLSGFVPFEALGHLWIRYRQLL